MTQAATQAPAPVGLPATERDALLSEAAQQAKRKRVRSPKHGLTPVGRGWVKKLAGECYWVCSRQTAPNGPDADRAFERQMLDFLRSRKAAAKSPPPEADAIASVAGHLEYMRRLAGSASASATLAAEVTRLESWLDRHGSKPKPQPSEAR